MAIWDLAVFALDRAVLAQIVNGPLFQGASMRLGGALWVVLLWLVMTLFLFEKKRRNINNHYAFLEKMPCVAN